MQNKTDKKPQPSIGGIWIRKSKNTGKEYFFIKIETEILGKHRTLKYKAFPNNFKKDNENTPDWRLYPDLSETPIKKQDIKSEEEKSDGLEIEKSADLL